MPPAVTREAAMRMTTPRLRFKPPAPSSPNLPPNGEVMCSAMHDKSLEPQNVLGDLLTMLTALIDRQQCHAHQWATLPKAARYGTWVMSSLRKYVCSARQGRENGGGRGWGCSGAQEGCPGARFAPPVSEAPPPCDGGGGGGEGAPPQCRRGPSSWRVEAADLVHIRQLLFNRAVCHRLRGADMRPLSAAAGTGWMGSRLSMHR